LSFHIPPRKRKFERCDISILSLHLVTNRVCNTTQQDTLSLILF